ncbi:MAG: alpha/beta hydrolase [Clostridia bacterium]|nr:alpha/beta hydrolase [Clostridia bacterium]
MKISRKLRKILIITLSALLLIIVTITLIASNFLASYALDKNSKYALIPSNVNGLSGALQEGSWFYEHAEDVYIENSDGIKLHAYLIENNSEYNNGNFMMVFHGYKSCASDMAFYAEQFYDMGYSVLLPDARAHGQSEGRYIGMGWPERKDNLLWINEIIKLNSKAKIGLFGVSMGGATVINLAGEALPEQVVLAIEDCGYSSVYEQFSVQMKSIFNLPAFPLLDIASLVAYAKSGVNLLEADCTKQAAKIKVPTLFIHGSEDKFVPYEMLDKLYNAANCKKEKLVIEGAGHAGSSSRNPQLYWTTVVRFIENAMV